IDGGQELPSASGRRGILRGGRAPAPVGDTARGAGVGGGCGCTAGRRRRPLPWPDSAFGGRGNARRDPGLFRRRPDEPRSARAAGTPVGADRGAWKAYGARVAERQRGGGDLGPGARARDPGGDRKSTRLNSSHVSISYA